MAKVCVYITTRNRRALLERAVNSVLAQSFQDLEIIIVDDSSSDDTPSYGTSVSLKNRAVRYLRLDNQSGACVARNTAIGVTDAEFITGLDDDDEFEPTRLARLLEAWNDRYSFVCANFTHHYGNSVKARSNFADTSNATFAPTVLLTSNEASNQVLTRTSHLREIGGFNASVARLQDWDTWLRLADRFGPFHRLGESLYKMHHPQSPLTARVSLAIPYHEALTQLLQRNSILYDAHPDAKSTILHLISILKGDYCFVAAIRDCMATAKFSPITEYTRMRLRILVKKFGVLRKSRPRHI